MEKLMINPDKGQGSAVSADTYLEIRDITPEDSRSAISNVYEQSWKHAYQGIVPQDYLDSIPKGRWALHIEEAGRRNLVMVRDGMIIGTSGFGKSRMQNMQDYGEVISLYLLPEYMKKGYGRQLLQAVISELENMGFDKVFLWVLEENRNARRFYERFGFIQNEHFLINSIGNRELKEVQYYISLKAGGK